MAKFDRQNLNYLTSGSDKALAVIDKFVTDHGGMESITENMDWGVASQKVIERLREAQENA